MTAKQKILEALRNQALPPLPRPGLTHLGHTPADVQAAFIQQTQAAGGVCWTALDIEAAAQKIKTSDLFQNARSIYCTLPGLPQGNNAITQDTSSETLGQLDLTILEGDVAVAENAAIWISLDQLPHRALPFIAEHLLLLLPVSRIVDHLHTAYRALDEAGKTHGCFIAGPSKTADIEQSLVIGAQGPKSATVLLIQNQ